VASFFILGQSSSVSTGKDIVAFRFQAPRGKMLITLEQFLDAIAASDARIAYFESNGIAFCITRRLTAYTGSIDRTTRL
jgi:hypothetical protein